MSKIDDWLADIELNSNVDKVTLAACKKLPKSIYFSTENVSNTNLLAPWQYKTGIFPGKFNQLIGSGSEGTVIAGEWLGKKAAFKFVRFSHSRQMNTTVEALDDLHKRLSEMKAMQETKGSAILPFWGHFR